MRTFEPFDDCNIHSIQFFSCRKILGPVLLYTAAYFSSLSRVNINIFFMYLLFMVKKRCETNGICSRKKTWREEASLRKSRTENEVLNKQKFLHNRRERTPWKDNIDWVKFSRWGASDHWRFGYERKDFSESYAEFLSKTSEDFCSRSIKGEGEYSYHDIANVSMLLHILSSGFR